MLNPCGKPKKLNTLPASLLARPASSSPSGPSHRSILHSGTQWRSSSCPAHALLRSSGQLPPPAEPDIRGLGSKTDRSVLDTAYGPVRFPTLGPSAPQPCLTSLTLVSSDLLQVQGNGRACRPAALH